MNASLTSHSSVRSDGARQRGRTGTQISMIGWLIVVLVMALAVSYLTIQQYFPVENSTLHEYLALQNLAQPLKKEEELSSRHILYALSGNHSGFLAEFEVSLKSILLNLPTTQNSNTTIHIMADQPAHEALSKLIFDTAQLQDAITASPLTIATYNIQEHQDKWSHRIETRMAVAANMTKVSMYRHTIGTFYRLLCGDVLPPTVGEVLYLDVDAIVLANLEGLWQRHVVRSTNIYFQWGKARCAGYIILRPSKMEDVWRLYQKIPEKTIRRILNARPVPDDQHVFNAVHTVFPNVSATLPPEFDISARDGPWWRKPEVLLEHRPHGAAMMHFNGGGDSKEAYFDKRHEHKMLKEHIWGDLAKYYVNLPWPWARFMMYSLVAEGRGFKVNIQHEPKK